MFIQPLQNVAQGGLAVFALGNLSDPNCVVEGRIWLGSRSHYNLDYYAPEHASVLSEWEGPLRVRRITWLVWKASPRLQKFFGKVEAELVSICRNNKPRANFFWKRRISLMDFPPLNQGEAAGILRQRRRGNALVQGSGQRGQAEANCFDYLDYSLCKWVSESILSFLDGTPY